MGSIFACDMAEMVKNDEAQLEYAVSMHLRWNHFPPIPQSMVAPCITAIELANKGEWDEEVPLPEGIVYKGERNTAPVWVIIEEHHLAFYVEGEEFY